MTTDYFRKTPLMIIIQEKPILGGWRTIFTAYFEHSISIEVLETTSAGTILRSSDVICF